MNLSDDDANKAEDRFTRAKANLESLLGNDADISPFIVSLREYCGNDHETTIKCYHIFRKVQLDLRGSEEHRKAFPTASFKTVLDWINFSNQPIIAKAESAEERQSTLTGYTRKTNKGEEVIFQDNESDYLDMEFNVPNFKKWKTPQDHAADDSMDIEVASDEEEEAPISFIGNSLWKGFIHNPFGAFKGSAYQVYGSEMSANGNVLDICFATHMNFAKTINLIQLDEYLQGSSNGKKGIRDTKGISINAFWVFPDNENDNEFRKVFNFHQTQMGVALSARRPLVKDIFILSVGKYEFAPSIFSTEIEGTGTGENTKLVRDIFLTKPNDLAKDRMLVITTVFDNGPFQLSPQEYFKLKAHK